MWPLMQNAAYFVPLILVIQCGLLNLLEKTQKFQIHQTDEVNPILYHLDIFKVAVPFLADYKPLNNQNWRRKTICWLSLGRSQIIN